MILIILHLFFPSFEVKKDFIERTLKKFLLKINEYRVTAK